MGGGVVDGRGTLCGTALLGTDEGSGTKRWSNGGKRSFIWRLFLGPVCLARFGTSVSARRQSLCERRRRSDLSEASKTHVWPAVASPCKVSDIPQACSVGSQTTPADPVSTDGAIEPGSLGNPCPGPVAPAAWVQRGPLAVGRGLQNHGAWRRAQQLNRAPSS